MSSIDERIVDMKFNNAKFESEAARSLGTLDSLKKALNFGGAGKGLNELSNAANKFNMSGMGRGIDAIASKFNALTVVGITALSNLTNKAVDAGIALVKSFGFEQMQAGFSEYETKIGSIQTILANTQKYGTKLPEVAKALGQLNKYADRTIYNFGDMTKNIGLFTNAGIRIKDATKMIQGFSNVAASSGTNAQGAASAAYQLSQALSAGTIRLMDWRSLQNVGMGNKNMQNSLIEIAQAMGQFNGKAEVAKLAQENFNGSLEKGWLSAGVMSKYLKLMSIDNKDLLRSQLKAIGITGKQADSFIKMQKNASDAAQKVRTWTQLVGTLQESVGSSWSETFEYLIGDFNEATNLWTAVNDTLGDMINASGDQRNEMLKGWDKLGGQKVLIEGLTNVWNGLFEAIRPVGEAWANVFPPTTGKQLYDMTVAFRDLTKNFKMGADAQNAIRMAFTALFSVLKVGGAVLKIAATGFLKIVEVIGIIGQIIGNAVKPVTTFLGAIGGQNSPGGGIDGFADKLIELRNGAIQPLIDWLNQLKDSLAVWGSSEAMVERMRAAAAGFLSIGERVKVVWLSIVDLFKQLIAFGQRVGEALKAAIVNAASGAGGMLAGIWETVKRIARTVGDFITNLAKQGADALKNLDPNMLLTAVNTGIFAIIIVQLKKFLDTGTGIIDAISETLGELAGTLKAMQTDLKAAAIMKIAIAIGVLAGSLFILSKIDPNNLASASAGLGVAFGSLAAAMLILDKTPMNIVKTNAIAGALVVLGASILIMAKALQLFSGLSWDEIARGLTSMAISIGLLVGAASLLDKMGGDLIKTAAGMVILAGAVYMLAGATKILGSMDQEALIQGGIALAALMAMLVGFMRAIPPQSVVLAGAGMLLLSGAIVTLTGAVAVLGLLPMDILIQGMGMLAILIGGLVLATQKMQSALPGAAAIVAIALAMNMLVIPILALGMADFTTVIQGIAALGITMAGLVFAANALQGAVAGVAGIIALAGAMLIMSMAIRSLAGLSLEQIGTALLGLGGALLIMGGASALLAPLIPVMLGLAGAVALFGLGIAAIGGGMMMFSMGLMLLGPAATVGAAGIKLLGEAAASLMDKVVSIAAVGAAFVVLGAGVLVTGAAVVVLGTGLIVLGAGLALVAATGLIGATALLAVVNAIKPLIWDAPTLLALGGTFAVLGAGMVVAGAGALAMGVGILALAGGLALMGGTMDAAVTGLERLSKAVTVATASGAAIGTLSGDLNKLADAAGNLEQKMGNSASSLMKTASGLISVASTSVKAVTNVNRLPEAIGKVVTTSNGLFKSMSSTLKTLVATMNSSFKELATATTKSSGDITRAIQKLATDTTTGGNKLLNAVRNVVKQVSSSFSGMASSVGSSAVKIGTAIINGMVRGLDNSSRIIAAARAIARRALAAAEDELGIASPSKEFEKLGKYVNEGFAKGLIGNEGIIEQAFSKMQDNMRKAIDRADAMIKAAQSTIRRIESKKPKKRTKKDKSDLAQAKKELKAAKTLKAKTEAAEKLLTKDMLDEKEALLELGKTYEEAAQKLDDANRALDDAKKKRDDAAKSWTDQYSTMDDMSFDEGEDFSTYLANLEKQIEATTKINKDLATLRAMGLNDKVYKQLVDKGLDAQEFINQMLDGGWGAIANINGLADKLDAEAGKLGTTASKELYQAGVDAAEGLVKGLQANLDKITKEMEKIADALVKAIKKKLGIKSPSKEFEKVGAYSITGLRLGLESMVPDIQNSAHLVGDAALDSLRNSMLGVGDVLGDTTDFNPTITPVLDLSDVEKNSKKIDSMIGKPEFEARASYNGAAAIAQLQKRNEDDIEAMLAGQGTSINYTQNNFSPKPLSKAEIYRQTRNQLSKVKGDVV